MELLWLPFSLATIFFYGVGQVLAKETRTNASSANYLLIFSVHIFAIWGIYWLVTGNHDQHPMSSWIQAAVAAALSGGAYIAYYEALKRGKVSIVGTVAGAYAPWTVILALIFLGEDMSVAEGVGVALVVSSMLVFSYSQGNGENKRTELLGILFALCSFLLWGTSAAMSKGVMTEIGQTDFIGVYSVVCPAMWLTYWLASTKGRFEMPKASARTLELSMLFLAFGGITMYVAFANGNVSIVSPIANLYPLVTIAVAKVRLREHLTLRQYVALAMLMAAVPLFSL
jgi:transporter family protein